jgi:hypothetical protein
MAPPGLWSRNNSGQNPVPGGTVDGIVHALTLLDFPFRVARTASEECPSSGGQKKPQTYSLGLMTLCEPPQNVSFCIGDSGRLPFSTKPRKMPYVLQANGA